jgi:hypothetical protein
MNPEAGMHEHRITITADDEGHVEIASAVALTDDEILDLLTLAIEATADKVIADDIRAQIGCVPSRSNLPSA